MIKKRLLGLLADAKKYVYQQVAWQYLGTASNVAAIYCMACLLESVIQGELSTASLLYVVAAIVCVCLRFAFDRWSTHASYLASQDVKRILRDQIYAKMLRLGTGYRQQVSTAQLVQLAGDGVEQLESYFGRFLGQFFYSLIGTFSLFVFCSFFSWPAALVLLVCVPLIPLSIVAVQKIAKRIFRKQMRAYTALGDTFLESLQGLTTLKVYGADEAWAKKIDQYSEDFRKSTMRILMMQLNSTTVMDVLAYGGAALGMIVTLTQFMAGNVSIHGAIVLLMVSAEFFVPLRLLGSYFHIAMNGMSASDKIFELLDLPEPEENMRKFPAAPAVEAGAFGTDASANLPADTSPAGLEIVASHLDFSYQENRQVLRDINLTIPAGGFISLVGESGSGKSTLANLIAGRIKSYTGDLTVGGIPVSEIAESSLTAAVTLVSHNSYLFAGTVRENLAMANPQATDEQMISALQRANLWNFLAEEQGLDTPLSDQGGNLSGGQRQRLALARGLLHDSEIYVFDEATSNIDVESETAIMAAIKDLVGKKTVILVSHRLANVVDSEQIFLVERGQIAETGIHSELIAQQGKYATVYQAQMKLENFALEGAAQGAVQGAVANAGQSAVANSVAGTAESSARLGGGGR